MSNIVPFESAKLPAYLTSGAFAGMADDLTSGVGQGYPIISIKGKNFHVVRGEERTLVTRPDDPDTPASSLEVVILRANPNLSKVYYSTGYVEGSDAKPECFSNDGKVPAADAETPQAKSCATCPHNQWGSKITDNGSKGKACSDSRRIAVATPDHLNEPMLIRVPAASLKALAQFGDMLKKRGVPSYSMVVTKVSFDYNVAHPSLTFKPIGFLDEAAANEAANMSTELVVEQIIGNVESARGADIPAIPERSETLARAEKEAAAKPKAAVAVEEEPVIEEKPAKPKAEAKPKDDKPKAEPTVVETTGDSLADEIAGALDDIDFDD